MSTLIVSKGAVSATIDLLKRSGKERKEGIVLWLGNVQDDVAHVRHVYQPIHSAARDFFHIPKEGMDHLMNFLDQHEVRVLAQVHSHPGEAFHSAADDKWALVRHLDALSLVLPCFASTTTVENFLSQVATFRLTQTNHWVEIGRHQLPRYLEIAS